MDAKLITLRSEKKGDHVHTTVFSGYEGQTLAQCAHLCQTVEEWKQLVSGLARLADTLQGEFNLVFEDDMQMPSPQGVLKEGMQLQGSSRPTAR